MRENVIGRCAMKQLTKINFLIDVFLFLVMAAVGGIGLLMKYRLVSGEERWEIYGSNPELFLWGLGRHQWGDLHLILGYVFWALLVFHILLHWRQITGIFRKLVPGRAGRACLVSGLVLVSLFLLAFAFVGPIEVAGTREAGGRHRIQAENPIVDGIPDWYPVSGSVSGAATGEGSLTPDRRGPGFPVPEREDSPADPGAHQERILDIDGTQTIAGIAARYGIPAAALKESLGLPDDIPDGERLGRLRRRFGFHMSEVESVILAYSGEN